MEFDSYRYCVGSLYLLIPNLIILAVGVALYCQSFHTYGNIIYNETNGWYSGAIIDVVAATT